MKRIAELIIVACLVCIAAVGCGGDDEKDTGSASPAAAATTQAIEKSPAATSAPTTPAPTSRTITDMRGRKVEIPSQINRVVTLDDGFVAGIMTILGQADKIVGLGSQCPQKAYTYNFESVEGEGYTYADGMNPVRYLNPRFADLPLLTSYGQATNYETLAGLEPDVVTLEVGSCYADDNTGDPEVLNRKIKTIESLGIPLVILEAPVYDHPDLSQLTEEIRLVGQVFGQEEKALEVAHYLEDIVEMIAGRTAKIVEADKPEVLMLGLSPNARKAGGAGNVWGIDTIESFFLEKIVHAKNAYEGTGSFNITLSAEQVLAINPDVIILPTSYGYHPPSELYTAPYYQNLQELEAVKNQRVVSLPWTPCNCSKRIEYPIEVMIMAKASYPHLFEDIKINQWVLGFYRDVYGVDEETAEGLRTAQWLDWTVEEDW